MNCLYCNSALVKKGRKYCGVDCYNKSKFGKKRPDVALRNKTNNPIHNPKSLEKMRKSLTGKKLPEEVRDKMSITHKNKIKDNPELLKKMLAGAEEKYLSKVRGTGWRLIRLKVLDRDEYKCQNCGEDKRTKLLVHHIDWQGKRRGVPSDKWNNKMSNLITLCYKCHNGIHRHKAKDYHARLDSQIAP